MRAAATAISVGLLAAALALSSCGDSDTSTITCTTRADCSDSSWRCSEGKCVRPQCQKAGDCSGSGSYQCQDGACVPECPPNQIGQNCQTYAGNPGTCAPTGSTGAPGLCYPACSVGKTCEFPFTQCEGSSKLCGFPTGW